MKPRLVESVESEPIDRELEQRDVAGAKREARTRDLCGPLEVDSSGGELQVVLDREVEGRRVAPAADLLGVLLGVTVGRVLVGRVRHPVEELLASAFGRRQLLFQLL